MNLNELIDELNELRDELAARGECSTERAGEVEVNAAIQPNYPLAAPIKTVTALEYMGARGGYVVYVASGASHEYASSSAWEGGVVELSEED